MDTYESMPSPDAMRERVMQVGRSLPPTHPPTHLLIHPLPNPTHPSTKPHNPPTHPPTFSNRWQTIVLLPSLPGGGPPHLLLLPPSKEGGWVGGWVDG